MDALTPLLIGLFSGFHCVAMCGGICALICKERNTQTVLVTNLGRITTYVLLGAVFAGIVQGASLTLELGQMSLWLRMLMGTVMVLLGLSVMLQIKSRLLQLNKGLPLWGWASRKLSQFNHHSYTAFFFKGMLWGLIPCGLLYGLLIVAATTADVIKGSTFMLFFGLGTLIPMLVSTEVFFRFQHSNKVKSLRRVSGFFIMFVGIWTIGGPWFSHHMMFDNNVYFTELSAVLDLCVP